MLYRPSRSNITLEKGPCINLCQKKIRWEKLIHITLHLRPLLSHRCVLAVPFPRTVPLPPSIPFLCPSNSRVPFHCVPGIPHIPFHSCSIPSHPSGLFPRPVPSGPVFRSVPTSQSSDFRRAFHPRNFIAQIPPNARHSDSRKSQDINRENLKELIRTWIIVSLPGR